MQLADRLLSALGLEIVQPPMQYKAASGDSQSTSVTWQDDVGWTDTRFPSFASEGYNANAIIYACIQRLTETASMAPLLAWDVSNNDEAKKVAYDSQLATLLRRPNQHMSWFELQELSILYLKLDGNVFLNTPRLSDNSPVTTILPMRPDYMRPVISKAGELLGYVQDVEGRRTPFLPHEVIHVKYPDPLDPNPGLGRGKSPLLAAAQVADVDNAQTKFLKQFFNNAVVPFGLLKTKQKLTDPMIAGIRERLRTQYAGMRNWGDVMILDADAEYQRLGLTTQELGFEDLDARNEARICAVLGVPAIVAGAKIGLDRGTYSNYEQARTAMWEDNVMPMYRRFQDALDQHFGIAYKNTEFRYDFSDVPALRENETERGDLAIRGYMAGVLKRSEARTMMKLKAPITDEEDGFRASDQLQLSAPGIGNQATGVDDGSSTLDSASNDAVAKAQRVRLAKSSVYGPGNGAQRMAVERSSLDEVNTALQAQFRAVRPTTVSDANIVDMNAALDATRETLRIALRNTVQAAADLAVQDAQRFMSDVGKAYAPLFGKPVGIVIDWALVATYVADWVEMYSFDLVGGIDATTRSELGTAVSAWILNGGTLPDLIATLEPIFGPVRAELIASTEVTRAYAEASIIAWRNSGVVERMVWQTANDEIVCPVCAPLGGLQYGDDGAIPASYEDQEARGIQTTIGSPFVHPGGSGRAGNYAGQTFDFPPAHPRCRCWLAPIVSANFLSALWGQSGWRAPYSYDVSALNELTGALALRSAMHSTNGVHHA